MNQTQRKSTAKFLYDIAKILVAIAVIGNIFSKEYFSVFPLVFGVVTTVLFFFFGYFMESGVEDE